MATKSARLMEWRQYFAQVAHSCKAQVAGLPKHERFAEFKRCMSANLKGAKAKY
mgnify:CR=1 FL=1